MAEIPETCDRQGCDERPVVVHRFDRIGVSAKPTFHCEHHGTPQGAPMQTVDEYRAEG